MKCSIRESIRIGIMVVMYGLVLAGCSDSDSTTVSSSEPQSETVPDTDTDLEDTSSAVEALVSNIRDQTPYTEMFADGRIVEASGLQRSLQVEGVFYTHNDSGDDAIIYVTDSAGQAFGSLSVEGNLADDWEAIAGARLDGEPYLIVGDIGDNDTERNSVQLYVVAEPEFDDLDIGFNLDVISRRVDVSYADGASYNAESLFIDGDNDTVVVVTKDTENTDAQGVWKGSLSSGLSEGNIAVEYRGLINLPSVNDVNAITDIDIHPNGREIAILTYGSFSAGQIFVWTAREGEGTADALTRAADRTIVVPLSIINIQAEGISYSENGEYLLVAAEGLRDATSTVTVVSATR